MLWELRVRRVLAVSGCGGGWDVAWWCCDVILWCCQRRGDIDDYDDDDDDDNDDLICDMIIRWHLLWRCIDMWYDVALTYDVMLLWNAVWWSFDMGCNDTVSFVVTFDAQVRLPLTMSWGIIWSDAVLCDIISAMLSFSNYLNRSIYR